MYLVKLLFWSKRMTHIRINFILKIILFYEVRNKALVNNATSIFFLEHCLASFFLEKTRYQPFSHSVLWLAGCLSNGQNVFAKFAQTCDEQMLKISRRYLDFCLSYSKISENLLQQMVSSCTFLIIMCNWSPFVTTNFWLFSCKSNKNQDIFLKFSAFVHHMYVQIWWKNFCCNSYSLPTMAHFGWNFGCL